MNSAAHSLSWEFFVRRRWSLLAATIGTAIIPALVLLLMKNANALEKDERGLETLHFVWVQCECLALISVALYGNGLSRRRYALPIETRTLALWQLLPGMVSCAVAFVAIAVALNVLYEIDWPIWGPAMFIAVASAAMQGAVWLAGHSVPLQLILMTLIAAPLSFWLKAHYGSLTGQPTEYWRTVTPGDVGVLAGFTLFSYAVSVLALTRDRRGDAPNFGRWREWMESGRARRPVSMPVLTTPLRAQFWYEWTQKGFFLPGVLVVFLPLFLIVWVWGGSQPEQLRDGLDGIGGALCIAGLVMGLAFGHCGRADGDPRLGAFLASRPLTDTSFAMSILRTTGRSVVLGWLLWAVTRGLLLVCLSPYGFHSLTEEFWLHCGVLVGVWTTAALPACATLTGRSEFCVALIVGAGALLIGQAVLVRVFVPGELRITADRILAYFDAFLCIGVAVWLFSKALRRSLLGMPTVVVAAVIWAGLIAVGGSALIASFVELKERGALFHVMLACGTALALTPIAAAPLAVSWNRHR